MDRLLLIQDRGRALRISPIPGQGGIFDFLDFDSPARVQQFLCRYLANPTAMQDLRRALAEEGTSASSMRLSNDAVVEQVSWRIWMGRIGVARELPRPLNPFTSMDEDTAPAEQAVMSSGQRREKKLTWIEVEVVEDATGAPVPWCRLVIRTPDGQENFYTTSSSGLIRIEALEPGTCDAWCELKGATVDDTLGFVAMGEKKSDGAGKATARSSRAMRVAVVAEHKVKTGETLDGIARAAGLAWQDLAKFNWGTDVPDQINEHLRDDVGCGHKTADGNNYIFDDSDLPGIVKVPSKWSKEGLATEKRHTIRVRFLEVKHWLEFNFCLASGHVIADREKFRLIHPDGSSEEGGLTDGRLRRLGVAPGEYKMKFKYLDQAKWLVERGHAEEEMGLLVTTQGLDPGEMVSFAVYRSDQARDSEPLARLMASVSGNAAQATWKYHQEPGKPAGGSFVFEATAGDKSAESGPLVLEAYPLEDDRGLQQRLTYLGYDCGPVDGIVGPKTQQAVKQFQQDYPPLAVDGVPGPLTRGELAEVVKW